MADHAWFAAGREADLVRRADGRVLRHYRDDRDAQGEADLMRYLRGQRYPVPRVHSVDGRDVVMDFVDGPTMAEAALSGSISQADVGAMLADLHNQLHAISPRSRGPAIIHLDLHPENVLLGCGGPIVIDWSTADEGPAGLDVAMTAVILAQISELDIRDMLAAFLADCASDPLPSLNAALELRRRNPMLRAQERAELNDATALINRMLS